LNHFSVEVPGSPAAPPLLSNAPKIAAALSSPVLSPPVETTVCGIARPARLGLVIVIR
jgi:hypothetical protein